MKVLIICGFFVACTHAASLKTEKRANGDVGCLFNGVFEYVGSRFASPDGCNSCTCSVTGVACSALSCHAPVVTGSQTSGNVGGNCVNSANNKVLASGQSYIAADGCNTCACINGTIMCTHIVCPGLGITQTVGVTCINPATQQLVQSGQSYPALDGCNTCTCINGAVTCTHNTCGNGGNCVNPGNNKALVNGQSFAASDGCNTCTCMNGNVVCSHIQCTTGSGINIGVGVHPGGNIHTGSTCYDNLQHLFHNDGDTYTYSISATGGCRTCSCALGILTCGQCSTGTVTQTCTDVATNHVYSNGQTVKAADGCNTCTCSNGKFTCTKFLCPSIG